MFLIAGALVACSSHSEALTPPVDQLPAVGDAGLVDVLADLADDVRHWFAGDVHMHVAPPDDPADVVMSAGEIAKVARQAHLDFVVLTPHLSRSGWATRRRTFRREWRDLADQASAEKGVTLIPGAEYNNGAGHFTIAGFDFARANDDDVLDAARKEGAFISVNHPFAVPTKIPGISASHYDMSYRAWTHGEPGFGDIDAVEVWNVPLSIANLFSRPGGATGERRAWAAANRMVHDKRRTLGAVGGTDNHQTTVIPTTWVLAKDTSPAAILDALRGGATCVGGPEAGTLRARGDGDPAGQWARVGGTVIAPTTTTLTWNGTARVFVDDVDQGEHVQQFVHDTAGATHTYRIEVAVSRCSFIYANL